MPLQSRYTFVLNVYVRLSYMSYISKYNLACDNTSMLAESVVVAHLIKLVLQTTSKMPSLPPQHCSD